MLKLIGIFSVVSFTYLKQKTYLNMATFRIPLLLLIKSGTFWYIERLPASSLYRSYTFSKMVRFLAHTVHWSLDWGAFLAVCTLQAGTYLQPCWVESPHSSPDANNLSRALQSAVNWLHVFSDCLMTLDRVIDQDRSVCLYVRPSLRPSDTLLSHA